MSTGHEQHEPHLAEGVPHVQTKREIQSILDEAGTHPRKPLGQHFLIDGNLMRRLVDTAQLDPHDHVLEIGAGTGGLTDLLAPRVTKVICVELDRDLHRVLTHRFSQAANVTIIQGDILASKHHLAPEVSDTLAHHDAAGNKPVKLVSNLPYRVATPVLMNLLLNHPSVRRFCFTVQAEVGDRLLAKPNTKAYGPLSIITQMLCTLSVITRLPPDAFWPKPAVDSVMIRMDVDDHPPINREHLGAFADLVRRTFEHRRKTIRSALGYVLSDLHRDRVCQHIDPKRRPEAFDVDEWLDIYRVAHA